MIIKSHRPAILTAVLLLAASGLTHADDADYYLVAYVGQYSDSSLAEDILTLQSIEFEDGYLATLGIGRVIRRPSPRRQWELEGQIGKWFGDQTNFELNVAINHRWNSLPWDRFIDTSFSIGNGLSLASDTPELEEALEEDGTARLLYYLSLEATFSPPSTERWAVLLRIHHRSGVFGLFGGVEGGSNTLSLGLRFNFE